MSAPCPSFCPLPHQHRTRSLGNWTPDTLAERVASGECAINADSWCLVHDVEAGLGHYLDTRPPEHHGHNPQTGIAYND